MKAFKSSRINTIEFLLRIQVSIHACIACLHGMQLIVGHVGFSVITPERSVNRDYKRLSFPGMYCPVGILLSLYGGKIQIKFTIRI